VKIQSVQFASIVKKCSVEYAATPTSVLILDIKYL